MRALIAKKRWFKYHSCVRMFASGALYCIVLLLVCLLGGGGGWPHRNQNQNQNQREREAFDGSGSDSSGEGCRQVGAGAGAPREGFDPPRALYPARYRPALATEDENLRDAAGEAAEAMVARDCESAPPSLASVFEARNADAMRLACERQKRMCRRERRQRLPTTAAPSPIPA